MKAKIIIFLTLLANFLILLSKPSPINDYSLKPTQKFYFNSQPWKSYLHSIHPQYEYWHIIDNPDYCTSRSPTNLSTSTKAKIFSDYKPGNLVKSVISKKWTLVHKENHLNSNAKQDSWLDPEISIFFHKSDWHTHQTIGSMFLCPGQRYNHIPGNEHLVFKDLIQQSLQSYFARTRTPSFLPETFDLSSRSSCLEFLEQFEPTPSVSWILKKSRNSHNAAGIEILTLDNSQKLLKLLDYGHNCGQALTSHLVQRYISSPLLVHNRKFDFRVYMVIANANPLVLLYHEGFLRVTLSDYNTSSSSASAHITNTQIAKDLLSQQNLTAADREKILSEQMWTLPDLEAYLVEQGKVLPGWADSSLVPRMKSQMLHLTRAVYSRLLPHPGVFELYGVDFLLDDDLRLWFLEINKSPAIMATTPRKAKILESLIEGLIEIELALASGQDFHALASQFGFHIVHDGSEDNE